MRLLDEKEVRGRTTRQVPRTGGGTEPQEQPAEPAAEGVAL